MKVKYFGLIIQLFIIKLVVAQDFHLAQYDANPLNLNPALTGERLGEEKGLRFNCNYRDQIGNYTNGPGAYKSIAQGLDISLNDRFSIGQYFGNNKSVNNTFSVTNFMVSGSYKIMGDNHNQNLSVGIQMGLLNKNFNPQNFTYDSQYSASSTNGFDNTLPSGENYSRTNTFQFSTNFGLYYRKRLMKDKLTTFCGFTMNNIAKSKEIINGQRGPMPIRYNFNIGAIYKLDEKLTLMPQLLFMTQNKATELNIGTLIYYKMGNSQEPIIGVSLRSKNAYILHVGLKVKGNTFRASYCIANNTLATYGNRGIEFSFIHISSKK